MTQHHSDAPEDGRRFSLEPVERERLLNMLGPEDENIHQIASRLGVEILNSGPNFIIKGQAKMATAAERIIKQLYLETAPVGKQRKAQFITPEKVNLDSYFSANGQTLDLIGLQETIRDPFNNFYVA